MRAALFGRSLLAALDAPNLGCCLTEGPALESGNLPQLNKVHAVRPRLPVQNQQEKANKLTHT
jgi:hypothetical protein